MIRFLLIIAAIVSGAAAICTAGWAIDNTFVRAPYAQAR